MTKNLLFAALLAAGAAGVLSAQQFDKASEASRARSRTVPASERGLSVTPRLKTCRSAGRTPLLSHPASVAPRRSPKTSAATSWPAMRGVISTSANYFRPKTYNRLPTSPSSDFETLFSLQGNIVGGVTDDQYLWATAYSEAFGYVYISIYQYDRFTGEYLGALTADVTAFPTDLAYSPYDDMTYGFFSNNSRDGYVLARISYGDNVEVTPVAAMEGNWVALAADAHGNLYGVQNFWEGYTVTSSALYSIDRLTGVPTLIGDTGMLPFYTTSASIDPATGRCFWNVMDSAENSYLCEVDLTTGQASVLSQFADEDEIVGLEMDIPIAPPGAPARPENLRVDFPGGAMAGTVSFHIPATCFDGSEAGGRASYRVMSDGVLLAEGSASYGTAQTVPVHLPAGGTRSFSVMLSNSEGRSPAARVKAFIGIGTPKAPENVTASADGRDVSVSWSAVTATEDNGYFDPAAVTYDVTRLPDGVTVAEGLEATSCTDVLPEVEGIVSYRYSVTARYDGHVSAPGVSAPIVAGTTILPYANDFSDPDCLNGFTILDANNDGFVWSLYGDAVRMRYNSSMAMDDWLVTPPLRLEAGKSYQIAFDTRCEGSSYPEALEVKLGTAPEAEAMTVSVVEPIEVSNTDYVTHSAIVRPETSGTYYLGFHGMSERDRYYLYLDNISIEAGIGNATPGAPVRLTAVADADGSHAASVSMYAPTHDMEGGDLESLEAVVLMRNGVEVHSFASPAPGEALSYRDDDIPGFGTYTYTAYAVNGGGNGAEASCSLFVGTPIPAAPEWVNVEETSDGSCAVTWAPCDKSASGSSINPERVSYTVELMRSGGTTVAVSGVEGTSYAFEAVGPGEQDFIQVGVIPSSESGEGQGHLSNVIACGTPYNGLEESFAGQSLSYPFLIENVNYGDWKLMNDPGVPAQDGDGGYIGMTAYFPTYGAALYTPKVSLEGMCYPALTFYSFTLEADDDNIIKVSVAEPGAPYTEVFSSTVAGISPVQGWHKVMVPLEAYAGQTVQVRIYAESMTYQATMIDNLRIGEETGYDMSVTSAEADLYPVTASDYQVRAEVANLGVMEAHAFAVELVENGEVASRIDDTRLEPNARRTYTFDRHMHALATQTVETSVRVVYAGDEKETNNESELLLITPVVSPYPAPRDLQLSMESLSDQVTAPLLSWTQPDIATDEQGAVTESFEGGDPFALSYPGWTMADGDGIGIGGFQQTEIPGITIGETTAAFIVFDTEYEAFADNPTFAAHNGSRYLASFYIATATATDDWAISPLLTGEPQTISFWARSYAAAYPERIRVLYSEGSSDPAYFTETSFAQDIPGVWTRYEVQLPAGAKRFAIVGCAVDALMLMVDDVSFIPESIANAKLEGYKVYRNYDHAATTTAESLEWCDETPAQGINTYAVTAIFAGHESAPSNFVSTDTSGASTVALRYSLTTRPGLILVSGAEELPVCVADAAGRRIYASAGAPSHSIESAAGVYLVTVGRHTHKINVR